MEQIPLSDFDETGFIVTTPHGSVVKGFFSDRHQNILFILTNPSGNETRIVLSVSGIAAMISILEQFTALGRVISPE